MVSIVIILKQKREILDTYNRLEGDKSIAKKRCSYKSLMDDVNVCTWQWFEKMCRYNLPISGHMIKEQAKVYVWGKWSCKSRYS